MEERLPTAIQRHEVRRLIESGAQLVEVLPAEEFEREHLPGAMSIPLKTLRPETVAQLQRDRPIVVYCADTTYVKQLSVVIRRAKEGRRECHVARLLAGFWTLAYLC